MKITIKQLEEATKKLKKTADRIDLIEKNAYERGYEAGKMLHEEDCVKIKAEEQQVEEIEQEELTEKDKQEMEEAEEVYTHPENYYPDGVSYENAHGFTYEEDGWHC